MSPDVLTLTSGAVRVQRGSGRLVIPGMKFWRGQAVGTRAWVTMGSFRVLTCKQKSLTLEKKKSLTLAG